MTMDCLQFRRSAGADPRHIDDAAWAHAEACPLCAAHLRELRSLDARILAALEVPVPGAAAASGGSSTPVLGIDRRRWLALAASIVAGVLVGTLLWVAGPQNSLARDLVDHLVHEPDALVVTDRPEDAEVLGKVLERGGIRLRSEIGTVSYANTCLFRGRRVPHLVVQTGDGPVTVMVLRHERPARPVGFDEQGHSGRIVPVGPGSIAVIGDAGVDLEEVASAVTEAVEWL
jgi:hypothetical protein